jgi:hypothetical protein
MKKPARRNGAARINRCVTAGRLGTLGKTKPVSRLIVRQPSLCTVRQRCGFRQRKQVLRDRAEDFAAATLQSAEGLLMTPRRTGTDGFFVSILKRNMLS